MEKRRGYCQIDVMEKLPQEIITVTLDQLDFDDVLNCIHVTKNWRYHICNSSASSPQHVTLDHKTSEKSGSFSSEFYRSSIRLLSDGVKSLKIDGETREKGEVLGMLISVPFNNLQKLIIGNVRCSFYFFMVINQKVIL